MCPLLRAPAGLKSCSRDAVAILALAMRPLTCLKNQVLIEQDSECRALYILQRGSLRVAAPIPKFTGNGKGGDGAAPSRGRSKKMSVIVPEQGGGRSKSTKSFSRFRMLEKPGGAPRPAPRRLRPHSCS